MEVTITNDNFESYKNGELPLVVDLVVGKCDVEENDDIAMEFGVRNIPTILFFKGGELVDKFVGAASKATLQEKFNSLL